MTPTPLFLIGAHKCGSTSLYEALSGASPIWAPDPKEPGWFTQDRPTAAKNAKRYWERFDSAPPGARYVLDGSTSYSQTVKFSSVVDRIWEVFGDEAKFIYLMRDPISRMRSGYVQLRSEPVPVIERSVGRASASLAEPTWYFTHYSAFAGRFGRESIWTGTFEELVGNPGRTCESLGAFLGVDLSSIELPHLNEGTGKTEYPEWLARLLKVPIVQRTALSAAESGFRPIGQLAGKARRGLGQPIEVPELTPGMLGSLWPQIHEEAVAMLDLMGRSRDEWPSLAVRPRLQPVAASG